MKQIIIVDDQYTTRLVLSQVMLQMELYEQVNIATFANPIKALEWIHENDTDLIIVDHLMKEMNGQQFMKEVRNIKRLHKTPVIGMSADNDVSLRYQFLEDGAADFFLKPFDYHECMLRCRNLLIQ